MIKGMLRELRRWILTRRWYGAGGEGVALSALFNNPMERPMLQSNDLSRSFTALNQVIHPH